MGKYSELAKANARRRHQARVKGKTSKSKPPALPKPPGGVSPFTTARCLDHIRASVQQRKKSKPKPSTAPKFNPVEAERRLRAAIDARKNLK